MYRLIVRQVLPMTALVVLLFIPHQALARPDQGDSRSGEAAGSFWSGLAEAFDLLVAAWEDNGPGLDPWGKPKVSSEPGADDRLTETATEER